MTKKETAKMQRDQTLQIADAGESACATALRLGARPALRPFIVPRSGAARLDGVESGDPGGQAVLLLHGMTDSWRSFTPLMARLPHGWRVVAFSQRWHGDSVGRHEVFSVEAMAADAAAVIEERCGGRAIVVGHCMGGNVAMRLAADRPDLVDGLGLINSFRTLKGNQGAQELANAIDILGGAKPDRAFIAAFQQGSVEGPVPDDFFRMVVNESAKATGALWPAALAALFEHDATPVLCAVKAPTLVLYGDRDPLLPPSEHLEIAAAVSNARAVRLDGRGHTPHWEDPARVAKELAAFVDSLV